MSDTIRPRSERGLPAFAPAGYGRSAQGRPLEAWLPARGADMLVVAGIHGEEPETTVALSSALRCLTAKALRSAVVLSANPDGLARGMRANARGVDLNRNFPSSDWSTESPTHKWTRDDPQDVTLSPGERPQSESETRALMDLIGRLEPRLVVALHAPLGCVLDPTLSAPAHWLSGRTGLALREEVTSPTPGTLDTWVREATGADAITLELPVISKDAALVQYLDVLVELLRAGPEDLGRHP